MEFRKVLYLQLQFYFQRYNSGTVKWKRYTELGIEMGGPELPHPSGHVTLPVPQCVHQPGSISNLIVQEFLLKVHCVNVID